MKEIQPIQTVYNGYKFRSRLEARWAVFFDAVGVLYDYEPEGYNLGEHGYYLPDFFLKNVQLRDNPTKGIWVEIKPTSPSKKEECKISALAMGLKANCIMLIGQPQSESSVSDGHYQYAAYDDDLWWDNCMVILKCDRCGTIKIEFAESSYMYCSECGEELSTHSETLEVAALKARQARFEYGETPLRKL